MRFSPEGELWFSRMELDSGLTPEQMCDDDSAFITIKFEGVLDQDESDRIPLPRPEDAPLNWRMN